MSYNEMDMYRKFLLAHPELKEAKPMEGDVPLTINRYRHQDLDKGIDVNDWSVDRRLIKECSYYPRPRYWREGGWVYPCGECCWELPNPSCKRSHILTDTRK